MQYIFIMWREQYMRRSRKDCQRGSNFDNVFLVDEGRKVTNTAKTLYSDILCNSKRIQIVSL